MQQTTLEISTEIKNQLQIANAALGRIIEILEPLSDEEHTPFEYIWKPVGSAKLDVEHALLKTYVKRIQMG